MDRYLAAYVAKMEPTILTRSKNIANRYPHLKLGEHETEVSRYFKTRLVGTPEIITYLMSHAIIRHSHQVVFIDTSEGEKASLFQLTLM